MKTLGLIGGISWISTTDYYKLINQGINEQLGGLNFSQCIIYSFNYADIKKNNDNNDWDNTFNMLLKACHHLQASGAEAVILCAATMHLIADRLASAMNIPLIHIATATAEAVAQKGQRKVALLGTRFTMEQDFFKAKLLEKGIEALIPAEEDRAFIHQSIFEELGKGVVVEETKKRYLSIIQKLVDSGAEGVILGCTEIPLIVKPWDVKVPVYDTVLIHAKAAIEFALQMP